MTRRDEATLFSIHGILYGKPISTAIAVLVQVLRFDAVYKEYRIHLFLLLDICPVDGGWHNQEPHVGHISLE